MNIYFVKRLDRWGYDDFDSFVCIADTELDARQTHPHGCKWETRLAYDNRDAEHGLLPVTGWFSTNVLAPDNTKVLYHSSQFSSWTTPDQTTAQLIGVALDPCEPSVVLASFNAG